MTGIYSGKPIEGSMIFDGKRSRVGYRINRLASSLLKPENRATFLADEDAYMTRYGLTETEKALIVARDWNGIVEHGGNIYVILKIAATVGSSLLAMGAQMRGETVEELLASLPGTAAQPRSE